VTLGLLSAEVGLSPEHVQRVFKRVVGVTPRAYGAAWRLGRLRAHLRKGEDVTASIFEAGYGSLSRVYEGADESLGMTPGTYGRGAPGVEIDYAIVDSPLGRLLVAATARGIARVALGDDDAALEEQLRQEYPSALLHSGGGEIGKTARQVVGTISGTPLLSELPIDIQATAFQRRVWDALRRIPRGETRSYSEVARSVGRPGAARAVARACAQNPLALVIPCHRVIGQDGSLSGYRWGAERKAKLLKLESSGAQAHRRSR
jgi:AraC family transcriptional regulator of adaptative response/methylated-DNA-[protein]-cysteine methyltransferase